MPKDKKKKILRKSLTKKSFAKVSWKPKKVALMAFLESNLTRGEVRELLAQHEQHIRHVMITAGWEAIQKIVCEQKGERQ